MRVIPSAETSASSQPLRQVPGLGYGAITAPDLQPRAVGSATAGCNKATTGLWVHEAVLVSPAPLLSAGAVAVPNIDRCPIRRRATTHVHALTKRSQSSVTAVPRPVLSVRAIAREDLDRIAVGRIRTGVIDAFTSDAVDRPGAPVSRLDYCGRFDVITRADSTEPVAGIAPRPS
jgi:hypothetical protein